MKIAIASHTEHYTDASGIIRGWGPTIREINFLAKYFEEIIHIGCLHSGLPPASCIPYSAKNIRFIPIPPSGGKSIGEKLTVLTSAFSVIQKVSSVLKEVDAMQLRVPTGMANYLLPYLTLKSKKPIIWVKYAGNWNQENAPAGYKFQRWWLQNNFLKCKVTINGKWPGQPAHCFTFENPCLDKTERNAGAKIVASKDYSGPYTACFTGRIETEKGVRRILDALPVFAKKNIRTIHFIGDGKEREGFEQIASSQNEVACTFHNSMPREEIPKFFEQSHFLLLPSTASEGFPKVVAEGANYGAIPVVSNVSSIGQYINDTNGYVWDRNTDFTSWLENIELSPAVLIAKSKSAYDMAEDFSFEHYYHKLQKYILNDH